MSKEPKFVQLSIFKDSDISYDENLKKIGRTDRKTPIPSPTSTFCKYKQYLNALDDIWMCHMTPDLISNEPENFRMQPDTCNCGPKCPYYCPETHTAPETTIAITGGKKNGNDADKRYNNTKRNKK